MKVFDFSNLKDITAYGLTYFDENGECQWINFTECRKNWVKHVNESGDFATFDGKPVKNITEKDTTCVGQRDWFADNPYIEFFTEPMIRFEIKTARKWWDFFNKRWKDRYYKRFVLTHLKINECGWSTFDLG